MPIADYSFLSSLHNLQHLDVSYSKFTDFYRLLAMDNLQSLTIEMSQTIAAKVLDEKVKQGLKINFC